MSFIQEFDSFVCGGDTITCDVDGYTVTARIAYDDDAGPPDARQDGFWPSLIQTDPGFIGKDKTLADFVAAEARAQAVMDAWKNDDWFYCGVIPSVQIEGIVHERQPHRPCQSPKVRAD